MNKTTNYGQNMLLHTSYWGQHDTFKLLPVTMDCPFAEVIYDPATTMMVVISKIAKETLQFLPRLDDDGNTMLPKHPKENKKPYKEQRTSMEMFQEYYITTKAEQEAFIESFAVNAKEYDYKKFLRDMDTEDTLHKVETPTLVDVKGNNLAKTKK